MDEVSEATPRKLRVPHRTFVVVTFAAALRLVADAMSGSPSLGLWLFFFLTSLLLTAFGVGFAQFALMLLAWASMTSTSSLSYLGVFVCVIEFALLMGVSTDVATTTTAAERRIDFLLRACLAVCSLFWVFDHWPRAPNLFSVTLAAFGLVIAFFGGVRWHGVYAVGMTLISGLAYASISHDHEVLLALNRGSDVSAFALVRAAVVLGFALLALLTWGVQQTRYGKYASEDSPELWFKHLLTLQPLRKWLAEKQPREAGAAPKTKHRVPRRTFLVITLAFALFVSYWTADISDYWGFMLVLYLGVLAFAAFGVRPAQISLMFAAFMAVKSTTGLAHFGVIGVVACLAEFALLMGLNTDKIPTETTTERRVDLAVRVCVVVCSLWWVIDRCPPNPRTGGITLFAFGVIIACLGGVRWHGMYLLAVMIPAMCVFLLSFLPADMEQGISTSAVPEPGRAEAAAVAWAFALITMLGGVAQEALHKRGKMRGADTSLGDR